MRNTKAAVESWVLQPLLPYACRFCRSLFVVYIYEQERGMSDEIYDDRQGYAGFGGGNHAQPGARRRYDEI